VTLENFTKFDSIIQVWAKHYLFPWRLIKAQVWQESNFDPFACSSCGAKGLMQLMPATAREMGLDSHEICDPEWSIQAGIKYDRVQYDHLPEIPDPEERLSFMLASYNGGRGYVNRAMELAYESEFGEVLCKAHHGKAGMWHKWSKVSPFLYAVEIGGKKPDADQMIKYVDSIWEKYHEL
jgi:hypothetical protein